MVIRVLDPVDPPKYEDLPLRPAASEASVQVHPLPSDDGLIVKIQTPREPVLQDKDSPRYVASPSDIVLCIDVSSSMDDRAQAPQMAGEKDEDYGLTLLDLAKHAARTVIETLDEKDRLGIVAFSYQSVVLQSLTPMTPANKAKAVKRIESMHPHGTTNIWGALCDGLDLFKEQDDMSGARVPALLLLTDGQPNSGCPPRGYVPMLRKRGELPATIHTFGFGYDIRSGLLRAIAEIGGGNYSFIPDAGMIGTVFIHSVANIQSTFATKAKLHITYPTSLRLTETTGRSVVKQTAHKDLPWGLSHFTILLGNLQYGQSRDIYLSYRNGETVALKAIVTKTRSPATVSAVLEYDPLTSSSETRQAVTSQNLLLPTPSPPLSPAEIAYHRSRSILVSTLSSFFPLDPCECYLPGVLPPPEAMPARLRDLAASLPASNPDFLASHPGCRSLLLDLCGPALPDSSASPSNLAAFLADPSLWTAGGQGGGQIALALSNRGFFSRWGAHYLPSLAGAHARQICTSFKDAGPLQYAADSPLFCACRDALDEAFNALPPPRPSRRPPAAAEPVTRAGGAGAGGGAGGANAPALASMRRYNCAAAGCFAGGGMVRLAADEAGDNEGKKRRREVVRVGRLRRGMRVLTPRGGRRVVAVMRMPVRRAEMSLVGGDGKGGTGGLLITRWHPVMMRPGGGWVFPKEVARRAVRYTGAVYSILLERDEDPEAHAIMVNGVWGVTLGHGLTERDGRRDVRAHEFFGDYDRVRKALVVLPRRSGGLVLGGGVSRDPDTGLINGFTREQPGQGRMVSARGRKTAVYA